MILACLVISALSLVVQLAIVTGLFLAARSFYRSMTAPLPPKQAAQPTQPRKPGIRLVGGEEK